MPPTVLILPVDVSVAVGKDVVGPITGNGRSATIHAGRTLAETVAILGSIVNVPVLLRPPHPIADIDVPGIDVDVPVDVNLGIASRDVGTWIRPIAPGTPPAPHVTTTPRTVSEAKGERAVGESHAEAPTVPRVVIDSKPPCPGTRIVIRTIPGTVMPARSVNNASVIPVAPHIARRITHVNHLGGHVVHLDISHIVMRA